MTTHLQVIHPPLQSRHIIIAVKFVDCPVPILITETGCNHDMNILLPLLTAILLVRPLPVAVHKADPVSTEILARSSNSWNGKPLPPYPGETPEITILRVTIQPGAQLPRHYHPVINAGIMIRGELTVITEHGDELLLHAGDPIIEVVQTWHYGRNDGDKPAEIIVFYAGFAGSTLTVKE